MRIVMELHCPEIHDMIEGSGESTASRIVTGLARLLAGRRCPTCPTRTLEPGLTVIEGREHPTGYCSCCEATWLPQRRLRLLAAGRLVGIEPASRAEVRS